MLQSCTCSHYAYYSARFALKIRYSSRLAVSGMSGCMASLSISYVQVVMVLQTTIGHLVYSRLFRRKLFFLHFRFPPFNAQVEAIDVPEALRLIKPCYSKTTITHPARDLRGSDRVEHVKVVSP